MKEMVGGCCVCSDERGWPDNPLVYCDGNGCTVAVHQACYGIVTVPTGPWYCRKCESPETKGKVRCELCPSRSGALKKADTGGWAHVVCALYIPEVRFGNVTSMEPIVLRLIPPERFTRTCYICTENGKPHRASAGACMACNKSGCKQQFHVTCAQSLGLLCEEAGNYLDNVKYCGYCQHHYAKLKKGGNVKTIPPYKPVAHDSQSSGSSSEKEGGASPMPGGSGTPTPQTKGSKGPGRKSSQNKDGAKSSHTSKALPPTTPQSMDKKKSPSRRQSSTGEGGSSSKTSTPAPSPQHSSDLSNTTKENSFGAASGNSSGASTSRSTPPSASPNANKSPSAGVISSVASSTTASNTPVSSTSSGITASVVQSPSKPSSTFQESVITTTDAIETKHTKKRKAAAAAASAAAEHAAQSTSTSNEPQPGPSGAQWEIVQSSSDTPTSMDTEKTVKKAKTDSTTPPPAHFMNTPPLPPPPPPLPPPPPPPMRSPRRLTSPMPGPSGMNTPHSTMNPPMNPPSHQPTMESGIPSHSPHGHPQRSTWGGLNVTYEMQQDPNKPSISGIAGSSKDHSVIPMPPMPPMPPSIRNKKRAAMAAVSMANPPPPPPPPSAIQMASTSSQSLANVRRHPSLPPLPPPHSSPPASPSMERQIKSKTEQQYYSRMLSTAPHMLGNELNPDSGAAARLQEQLNAELAAHAVGGAGPDPIVPPPLINKAAPGSSGRSSGAQSLDQLLERQWEQGSQFLMEQAQHFDIASLLSCLHQLRTENVRLEEHVANLLQRRDHLLAVNARLAIPLNSATAPPPEQPRCSRDGGPTARPPPPSRGSDPTAERDSQVAQHVQLMMREVQQKHS